MSAGSPVEGRLYQQVADRIRAQIQAGGLRAGDRLPAERDLAQQLGVSRPSLREALIALEIDGTVEIRMGSGIYVQAARGAARTAPAGDSPEELMQARAALEGAVAALAAARVTPEHLGALRAALDRMGADIAEGRPAIDSDRAFHLTLAGQTGNSVLVRLVAGLFDDRHSPIAARLRSRFDSPATWALALAEHEAVLAALAARDPLRAQAAMHAHLEQSTRRWLEEEPR
ncbi:FadR/GntR family transcriptional regulator [Methylobacterium platani]|uniref:GntR family transcriptional regulator n=1 Tax=Methylobacterium platani TaxID=427683 RepID=A0A179SCI2_9HYPH|nr:FadR/GntR family transcriptional regulator [Methylobacterium platani]OAS25558.1 GntR family transcriptional regulator [Methylobacterium platani]